MLMKTNQFDVDFIIAFKLSPGIACRGKDCSIVPLLVLG
jgi:hypothetical protein